MDPRVEMFLKGEPRDQFFNMKALAPRPVSNATEMFDTDFEDDDSEADEADSPRFSLNSSGRRSETTLSSFEEVHTPNSNSQEFQGFNFDLAGKKSVQGPRGPHLFRTSIESDQEYTLGMSPMTPRPSSTQLAAVDAPPVPQLPTRQRLSLLTDVADGLNLDEIATWTPRQVARWMWDAGFEQSIVEKFQENDISGAILITLKFEDLRELDIPSFGQRTKVWNEIHVLRGSAPSTPKPATPIDESMSPCTEIRRPGRHSTRNPSLPRQSSRRDASNECTSPDEEEPRRRKSSKKRHHRKRRGDDPITPLESVSIVGIEQLMPKPHNCSKGENCSKWRRQQRLIDAFNNGHPISPEKGGSIWVAGDPGNAATTGAIAEFPRPTSDAVTSVVASSDILGPGAVPQFRHLQEESLRNVELRDPQDNVKQFLQFQHMDPCQINWSSEVPPTPPFEMFPAIPMPHSNLQSLPRLAIPPPRPAPPRSSSAGPGFSPYRMERVNAQSPELRNQTSSPVSVYRFGTPFSETDAPLTAIPLGPVSRDVTQSVPPNMSYRSPITPIQRTQSRASGRRPSFAAMPRLDENKSMHQHTHGLASPGLLPDPLKAHPAFRDQLRDHYKAQDARQQEPPYPWSPVDTTPTQRSADDIAYAGYMKKRKTKMLRHEWQEHHFTLKGTRLEMHKDARALETLEYIDVDDYAIACSSLASGSKLNAAFKAMNISRGNKKDEAAFSFQLIPATLEKGMKLRKRESTLNGAGGEGKDGGAKGKTHHFAVKSRDERIDWMRELMLAKALKQKNEGYVVNVNGNMI